VVEAKNSEVQKGWCTEQIAVEGKISVTIEGCIHLVDEFFEINTGGLNRRGHSDPKVGRETTAEGCSKFFEAWRIHCLRSDPIQCKSDPENVMSRRNENVFWGLSITSSSVEPHLYKQRLSNEGMSAI
jgi:hypothetical protein